MQTLLHGKTDEGSILLESLIFCTALIFLIALILESMIGLQKQASKIKNSTKDIIDYQNLIIEDEVY